MKTVLTLERQLWYLKEGIKGAGDAPLLETDEGGVLPRILDADRSLGCHLDFESDGAIVLNKALVRIDDLVPRHEVAEAPVILL